MAADVTAMFDACDEHFGRLDVLVNNAGIAGGYGPIDDVDPGRARPPVVGEPHRGIPAPGRPSRHGHRPGWAGRIDRQRLVSPPCSADPASGCTTPSKGALDDDRRPVEGARPEGIRVNAVRPGLIESDFHDHAPPGRIERLAPSVPLGRPGVAAEVATAVRWFASAEASYVTGAFIDIGGGR
ncbi:MAG: SDR family oxidoreductase [Ilumatobacteraceae bacterium]